MIDLGIGGLEVNQGIHIAHFYYGSSQRMDVLSPYIRAGLQGGDFVVLVIDPKLAASILEDLGEQGKDAVTTGQLKTAKERVSCEYQPRTTPQPARQPCSLPRIRGPRR